MRIAFSIIFVLLLTSLTPQRLKKEEKKDLVINQGISFNKIDYDSLINDIKQDTEQIKKDRLVIEKNESYVNKLEKQRKVLIKEINNDIKKLETKKDTIYLSVGCINCKYDSLN